MRFPRAHVRSHFHAIDRFASQPERGLTPADAAALVAPGARRHGLLIFQALTLTSGQILIVVVGLTAVGNLDIWRYLVFALPVVVVLVAHYYRDRVHVAMVERSIAAGMTFVTVFTQRPFAQMDTALYFRDWFPLYDIIGQTPSPDLLALWVTRLIALALLAVTLILIGQSNPPMRDSVS